MDLKYAIVRKPGKNFADGITNSLLGKPDYKLALLQHENYCRALKDCGLNLLPMEADLRYPDGCFVEDTAVITGKGAVILNLCNPSRQGEETEVEKLISDHLPVSRIKSTGTVEGGDILRIGNHFYIGLSERTNKEGARQLSEILKSDGYTSSTVAVEKILHLKTGITHLGGKNVAAISGFANKFSSYKVTRVSSKESYAANCLYINDNLIIPSGNPVFRKKVKKLGYDIIELDMSEFQKMDGGLSCLSLLF